ncbi:MAG: CRISPR-associated endonuclease Cas2 [Caldilineaceae bacterium]|nr:CRISPR-associated endonuclease Cas2 [Caldilineaceae bacterium]
MKKAQPGHTLYVIAYDIPNDKRRTKVHKTLSGFGTWTQFSLFECHLSDKQYLQLRQKLDRLLNSEQDSVRFYTLCAACRARVETIGSDKPADPAAIVV